MLCFRPRSSSRDHGFTLMELMVVVGIMALVAGMVVAAYDSVQQRAEQAVARQQLATVRDALLRFRVDMGYFPGEGALAPASLKLDGFKYVNGSTPDIESPDLEMRSRWATHPLNLWMLFEQPLAVEEENRWDANRWNWKPGVSRGWQGPYLGQGMGARLDAAGDDANTHFLGGVMCNRLYAVTDLIGSAPDRGAGLMRWVSEDRPVTALGMPDKKPLPLGGRPIAFLFDEISQPGWVIYNLVSAGADGIFQTVTTPVGDDIVIEVSRHKHRQ